MYYSEISIAALHQARSQRLQADAEIRTRKSRGSGLRSLPTRSRKALAPAPTAQPVYGG